MPWFITSIVSKGLVKKHPQGEFLNHRTFGFFDKYCEAYKAVTENQGNMHECLYDYLIVEYIETGIHPLPHVEEWWEWNEEHNKWKKIDYTPKQFMGIINWALG